MKAFELIANEKHWCKDGNFTGRNSDGEKTYCIAGAVFAAYKVSEDVERIVNRVLDEIYDAVQIISGERSIAWWNDDPNTTHKMVIDLLKELDI